MSPPVSSLSIASSAIVSFSSTRSHHPPQGLRLLHHLSASAAGATSLCMGLLAAAPEVGARSGPRNLHFPHSAVHLSPLHREPAFQPLLVIIPHLSCRFIDGSYHLISDLDVKCFQGAHLAWSLGGGVPGLLFWVGGIPLAIWLLLRE